MGKLMVYAEKTSVPVDRSKAEIEKTLTRYGADQFIYATKKDCAMIAFRMNEKFVRFVVPFPNPNDEKFIKTPTGRIRRGNTVNEAYEQEIRRRWRALALVIKAKLEAVDSGITLFEEEFMAHILLPNDQTVGEFMIPHIEEAYQKGKMPNLLPESFINKIGNS